MKTFSSFLITALLFSCSAKTPDASAYMPLAPAADAVSGGDMYYELLQKMSPNRPGLAAQDIHTRIFLSASGDARVERDGLLVAGRKMGGMILIGSSSKPNESTTIDEKTKTYTINHFDTEQKTPAIKITSTVSAAGEETILGYRSVHVRIISVKKYGGSFATNDTLDLWKSKEVPIPSVFGDWMNRFESKSTGLLYAADVPEKLKQMGCVGFTTKMEMHVKTSSFTQTVIRAEHRDLSSALFKVPAGYTEKKENQ